MTWWNALALAACAGYIVFSAMSVHAEITCGDKHMGGQVCARIVDPFDKSTIEVGCHPGPCPNWPADVKNDADRMEWLSNCALSDYETIFRTDCPIYMNVIWAKH